LNFDKAPVARARPRAPGLRSFQGAVVRAWYTTCASSLYSLSVSPGQ